MKNEPLFFAPVFKERIWGGENLTKYGYQIPSNKTGECWAFSAHPTGQSLVENGELTGCTLGEIWTNHSHLFGNVKGDRFPLLTKILDANQDLSVQVHPDDVYAQIHENGELGKTECWYIIDCLEGAELIYGHYATSKQEFIQMIEAGQWDHLLRRVAIKPGDFFFVPSGTIHAICKGTITLETQQNSDTNYRVYDYGRLDKNGNLRELQIKKFIDVTTIPFKNIVVRPSIVTISDLEVTTFVECDYFTVYKWDLRGYVQLEQKEPFLLVSVIDGAGILIMEHVEYPFKKGDHFLLPFEFGKYTLSGWAKMIVSHI